MVLVCLLAGVDRNVTNFSRLECVISTINNNSSQIERVTQTCRGALLYRHKQKVSIIMLHTGSKSMLEMKGKKIKATDDQCVTTFHKEGELTKKDLCTG